MLLTKNHERIRDVLFDSLIKLNSIQKGRNTNENT